MTKIPLSQVVGADLSQLSHVHRLIDAVLYLKGKGYLDNMDMNAHTYENMFQLLDEKYGSSPFNDVDHMKKCVVSIEKIAKLLEPEKKTKRAPRRQSQMKKDRL